MSSEPVSQLASALHAAGAVLDSISVDQWALGTPCSEWSVRDLACHLVAGNDLFAAALAGEARPAPLSPDIDLPSEFRRSTRDLLRAFAQPGALERNVEIPIGTVPGLAALHLRATEALVHGWDLARATGQDGSFPDDLAEQELTFTRARLGDIPAGRHPFAPPQPVADDAPAIDRLAACLGRTVPDGAERRA